MFSSLPFFHRPEDRGRDDRIHAGGQDQGMVPRRRAAGSVQRPDRTERGNHPAEDTGGPGGEPVLCRDERAEWNGAAPDPEAEPDGRG